MEAATITSRTLQIDGMTGEACVQKVMGALKGVPGVTTETVKVGSATIGANKAGSTAACAAIGIAGFEARDSACTGTTSTACQKVGDQPGAMNAGGCCTEASNAGGIVTAKPAAARI